MENINKKIKQTKKRIEWIEGAIDLYNKRIYTAKDTENAIKLFTESLEKLWKN